MGERGAFEDGQAYVALSRCKSMEKLYILRDIRRTDIMVNQTVKDWFIDHANAEPNQSNRIKSVTPQINGSQQILLPDNGGSVEAKPLEPLPLRLIDDSYASELGNKIAELKEELTNMKTISGAVEEQNAELQDKIKKLTNETKEQDKTIREKAEEIEDLQNQVTKLRKIIDEFMKKTNRGLK